jgi:hypothetical protein
MILRTMHSLLEEWRVRHELTNYDAVLFIPF